MLNAVPGVHLRIGDLSSVALKGGRETATTQGGFDAARATILFS
jgi:hypothetical protein